MPLQNGVRTRVESWANQRVTLIMMGLGGTLTAYGLALSVFQLFGQAQAVWFLFSAMSGFAIVGAFYAWCKISTLNRDITTGLYRRQVAEAYLARIAEGRRDVTLALIDLNGLKEVNTKLGHEGGDLFIKQAAKRLQRLQRLGTRRIVSRWGLGDEFLIIDEGHIDLHDFCNEVEEALHAKHPVNGLWGLGVAGVARSRTGETRVALECADAALYRAKRTFYETDIAHVYIYDSHFDGPPKYNQHTKPSRPARRRRDHTREKKADG